LHSASANSGVHEKFEKIERLRRLILAGTVSVAMTPIQGA
jgi:hypothetical protein